MELPTYTSIWRIEKRLYKLYDFRLPMPVPVGQIAVFTAITVPYVVLLTVLGLPFNHTLFWLYVLPPAVLTWLATRPVLESKRLPELLISQVRYLGEPSTWCRMSPLAEKDEVVVVGRAWRRDKDPSRSSSTEPQAQPQTAPAQPQRAPARPQPAVAAQPARSAAAARRSATPPAWAAAATAAAGRPPARTGRAAARPVPGKVRAGAPAPGAPRVAGTAAPMPGAAPVPPPSAGRPPAPAARPPAFPQATPSAPVRPAARVPGAAQPVPSAEIRPAAAAWPAESRPAAVTPPAAGAGPATAAPSASGIRSASQDRVTTFQARAKAARTGFPAAGNGESPLVPRAASAAPPADLAPPPAIPQARPPEVAHDDRPEQPMAAVVPLVVPPRRVQAGEAPSLGGPPFAEVAVSGGARPGILDPRGPESPGWRPAPDGTTAMSKRPAQGRRLRYRYPAKRCRLRTGRLRTGRQRSQRPSPWRRRPQLRLSSWRQRPQLRLSPWRLRPPLRLSPWRLRSQQRPSPWRLRSQQRPSPWRLRSR